MSYTGGDDPALDREVELEKRKGCEHDLRSTHSYHSKGCMAYCGKCGATFECRMIDMPWVGKEG